MKIWHRSSEDPDEDKPSLLISELLEILEQHQTLPQHLQEENKPCVVNQCFEILQKLVPLIAKLESKAEEAELIVQIHSALEAADLIINIVSKVAQMCQDSQFL